MENAQKFPCEILKKPKQTNFLEDIRVFQGCPTIAVTKGGRIYAGWYAGGLREPHMDNYNVLVYSDDSGKSWTEPFIIIPSNKEKKIHALDIQLFIDKKGALHVCWVQNNVSEVGDIIPDKIPNVPDVTVDGTHFNDFGHSEWEIVCEDPDSANPVFSKPRYIFSGFLRCKPTFLANGDILYFNYDQLTDRYAYSISKDDGKTFTRFQGSKKLATLFDETMAYQMQDGTLRMFARTSLGELAECYSYDNGLTWTDATLSGIVCANTRFFVSRTPSGRIILIVNDDPSVRQNITAYLSDDDGKSWKYKKSIDNRLGLSYPDVDFYGDKIYLTYDRGREFARQILFASFTEQDIIDDNDIEISVISEPKTQDKFYRTTVIESIENQKLIAILRNVPKEKIIDTAEALYAGGIRLLEVTYKSDGSENDETADKIRILSEHFKDRMMIGAGTVLTLEQVHLTKASGGLFIISPNVDIDVIKATYRVGMVSLPGAFTPSEAVAAKKAGADFIKLFPASVLGPDYIKAITAPLSDIKFLAVGGITTDNISEYLNCGVCGFGLGSNIVKKDLIENNDFASITALANEYVKAFEKN